MSCWCVWCFLKMKDWRDENPNPISVVGGSLFASKFLKIGYFEKYSFSKHTLTCLQIAVARKCADTLRPILVYQYQRYCNSPVTSSLSWSCWKEEKKKKKKISMDPSSSRFSPPLFFCLFSFRSHHLIHPTINIFAVSWCKRQFLRCSLRTSIHNIQSNFFFV